MESEQTVNLSSLNVTLQVRNNPRRRGISISRLVVVHVNGDVSNIVLVSVHSVIQAVSIVVNKSSSVNTASASTSTLQVSVILCSIVSLVAFKFIRNGIRGVICVIIASLAVRISELLYSVYLTDFHIL